MCINWSEVRLQDSTSNLAPARPVVSSREKRLLRSRTNCKVQQQWLWGWWHFRNPRDLIFVLTSSCKTTTIKKRKKHSPWSANRLLTPSAESWQHCRIRCCSAVREQRSQDKLWAQSGPRGQTVWRRPQLGSCPAGILWDRHAHEATSLERESQTHN